MNKKSIDTPQSAKSGRFVIGRSASIHISKIEGLRVSSDIAETFKSFDDEELSSDARRAALAAKFGKQRR